MKKKDTEIRHTFLKATSWNRYFSTSTQVLSDHFKNRETRAVRFVLSVLQCSQVCATHHPPTTFHPFPPVHVWHSALGGPTGRALRICTGGNGWQKLRCAIVSLFLFFRLSSVCLLAVSVLFAVARSGGWQGQCCSLV